MEIDELNIHDQHTIASNVDGRVVSQYTRLISTLTYTNSRKSKNTTIHNTKTVVSNA